MSYFIMGGLAVASIGVSYVGSEAAAGSAIRNANSASRAEGEAIAKERLNKTISNSYQAAFSQMALALEKRKLTGQGATISAARLSAQGEVNAMNAATGTVGASVAAVSSDIDMKADQALDATHAAFEQAVQNQNSELDMMVLNTDQSTPTVRKNEVNVPSSLSNMGMAIAQTAISFAGQYASRQMQLGLGKSPGGVGTAGNAGMGDYSSAGLRKAFGY